MLTKEKAQEAIICLDNVSRKGLPINALPNLMMVAQVLQDHIDGLVEEESKKSSGRKKKPGDDNSGGKAL